MPDWVTVDNIVKITPALLTSVLGSLGVWIAYNQHRTNRDKLRLDLYDKRLEAYEKLQEYFNSVMAKAMVTPEAMTMLFEARYKSLFIFGDEINDHIRETQKKAVRMQSLRIKIYGQDALPVGKERKEVCEEGSKLLLWISDQQKSSPERYRKYLKFG